MEEKNRIVATGTWFYDKTVPRRIAIYAKSARYAASRYDDDDQLDESQPIPQTPDGMIYSCFPSGDHLSLEAAKAWADAQPWGPVTWD